MTNFAFTVEAIIQMLKFENYSIEILKKYIPIIEKSPLCVNDVSTGSFFMWHKGVNLAFCLTEDGSFISKQDVRQHAAACRSQQNAENDPCGDADGPLVDVPQHSQNTHDA